MPSGYGVNLHLILLFEKNLRILTKWLISKLEAVETWQPVVLAEEVVTGPLPVHSYLYLIEETVVVAVLLASVEK